MNNAYKIAVIGGTGKVGRYIASEALKNDYQVRMLVRNPEKLKYRDGRIEVVTGAVENIDTIELLLRDCQIVINCFGQPMRDTPMYSRVTRYTNNKRGHLMYMSIITLASILLWCSVIYELNKPSKKKNNRKIIFLASLASLSTLVITLSVFQKLLF
ncbi:NAD(P)H-binding protein [Ectobacillus polymachus]|uniref:NAD(P)H-binding protein n=1 Tax=Ectobacillus polymachus TaxID=1508806 RepID=UPI003A8854A0